MDEVEVRLKLIFDVTFKAFTLEHMRALSPHMQKCAHTHMCIGNSNWP